jgi:shikimate kinase
MKKIILLGYMGCGSLPLLKLSKTIKVPFVDLDTYIEKKADYHNAIFLK